MKKKGIKWVSVRNDLISQLQVSQLQPKECLCLMQKNSLLLFSYDESRKRLLQVGLKKPQKKTKKKEKRPWEQISLDSAVAAEFS